MIYLVSARHVSPDYQIERAEFDTGYSSRYTVREYGSNKWVANAPKFGMGHERSTPEDAILDLLKANGCYGISIQAFDSSDFNH